MKSILIWCLVVAARADHSTHVYIDGIKHQTEILIHTNRPYSLTADHHYNYLYYGEHMKTVIFDLNTNEFKPYLARNRTNVKSLAVDRESHDLYVGTYTGVYRYKPSTGDEQPVGLNSSNIDYLYFKDVLYYHNDDRSGEIYTFINGRSEKLIDMKIGVDQFVIDKEDAMVFSTGSGLFIRHLNGTNDTIYSGNGYVRGLTLDRNGKVYFIAGDAVHEVIKHKATYRTVYTDNSLMAIAFDKDNNFILHDGVKIYRLRRIPELGIFL